VLAGELPKGLELSADGALAGTPDAPAGQYTFTVGATDKYGLTARLDLVFTVLPPKMFIDTATIANAVRGRAYTATIAASGGSEPYTFTVMSGKLPPGIKLGLDGTLSGRPTRAGAFGFTVQATDANGVTRVHYYGLRVRQPAKR
jgi:large repetitive protein